MKPQNDQAVQTPTFQLDKPNYTTRIQYANMGKRKSTAEDKAGEMDVDGDSSDDVSQNDENE